jgi:phosphorylcholine metabolism protein LicD
MPYKINSYKKTDKNLITLINILKEYKINYWICHGTLLGIIRDKELIPGTK